MSRDISLNRVLAAECCVPTCSRQPEEDAPFPICMKHMRQVFRYFDGYAELAKQIVSERIPVDQEDLLLRRTQDNFIARYLTSRLLTWRM